MKERQGYVSNTSRGEKPVSGEVYLQIELLLNHIPKDRLIRTYQVGQQAEKLRNLFLRWGDFIKHEIIQPCHDFPDNVVEVSFSRK